MHLEYTTNHPSYQTNEATNLPTNQLANLPANQLLADSYPCPSSPTNQALTAHYPTNNALTMC